MILRGKKDCKRCHGKGQFQEQIAERWMGTVTTECDCIFEGIEFSDNEQQEIEEGFYDIKPFDYQARQ